MLRSLVVLVTNSINVSRIIPRRQIGLVIRSAPVVRSNSIVRSTPTIRSNSIVRSNLIVRSTPIIRSNSLVRQFSTSQCEHQKKFICVNGQRIKLSKIISVRWYTRFWYNIFGEKIGQILCGDKRGPEPYALEIRYKKSCGTADADLRLFLAIEGIYIPTDDSKTYIWAYRNLEECKKDCEQIKYYMRK